MLRGRNRAISLLLVLILFSGIVVGCSSSKSVSAKVDQKLELAIKYLSEQKYEEAILAYQEVIKIDSKNITAYRGVSLAYVLQEKPDKAEQALQDGLKAVPKNVQLQLAMAGLMFDQGNTDKAEAIYKDLLTGNAPTTSAYSACTYYLTKQGRAAEAIALLEQAAAKNSKEYKINSMLAELYLKNGNKDKALAAINKSLTQQLDQSASYKLLEEIYKDKWAELIALGDQYIRQNQARTGQLLKLSGLLGMGKYEDVIKLYGELTTDLKDNTRVRFMVARAYTKLGQKDQSVEMMKPIKVADLKDAGILADLANFYLESGDKDNARKIALQGIAADDTSIDNYVVMFKSYAGEDKNLAQIWALKYLIASPLSHKKGLAQLRDNGLEPASVKQSKDQITSNESDVILKSMIYSDAEINEKKKEYRDHYSFWKNVVYVDKDKNIYICCVFSPNAGAFSYTPTAKDLWKNVIIKTSNLKIYDRKSVEKNIENEAEVDPEFISKFNNVVKIDGHWFGVIYGDLSFEEQIEKAGYTIDSFVFANF